jgi:hypothetical protein
VCACDCNICICYICDFKFVTNLIRCYDYDGQMHVRVDCNICDCEILDSCRFYYVLYAYFGRSAAEEAAKTNIILKENKNHR